MTSERMAEHGPGAQPPTPSPRVRWFERRPVAAFLSVAIGLELLLIPAFLLSGADARIETGLERAGLPFDTDLVTAVRVVFAYPQAAPGVLLSIAQVASPDLAMLLVAGLGTGAVGLATVAGRFRPWSATVGRRRGLIVWAVTLAVFTGLNLASALLHHLFLPSDEFTFDPPRLGWELLGGLLIAMFLDAGAVFEESGWRGFVLPLLQARMSPVRASVLLGLAWSLWHMPVKFPLVLDYGWGGFVAIFAALTVKFVMLSLVMSYFFNRAGQSTLLAIAMHGLSNDSLRLGGLAEPTTVVTEVVSELDPALPMAVLAAFLIWHTRGRLGVDCRGCRR